MKKLLLLLLIFTAINWHFAWNGYENVPGDVEVWNGDEQIEVLSGSVKYEGRWLWWVVADGKLIDSMSFYII